MIQINKAIVYTSRTIHRYICIPFIYFYFNYNALDSMKCTATCYI